jgi:hypothetical protein
MTVGGLLVMAGTAGRLLMHVMIKGNECGILNK